MDFEVEAQNKFECDKTLRVINNSMSLTDPIVSYSWSFGNRSVPSSSTDFGPHDILYQSFGNKTIALTVKSSKGCLVTQILDFLLNRVVKIQVHLH